MPRTPNDIAYENATLERDFLPDLCDIEIYGYSIDGAGGRFSSGLFLSQPNVPCRFELANPQLTRADQLGVTVNPDYEVKVGRNGPYNPFYFHPDQLDTYRIEIRMKRINGVTGPPYRFLAFVAYLEGTDERYRTLIAREVW